MSSEEKSACYTTAFQNLLYNEPLFQYIGEKEQDMNVLVLGWNQAVSAFVDQCLQAGQMRSHFLNLSVFTRHAENAKEEYLASRPALADFVNVNGSLQDLERSEVYGFLNFEELTHEDQLLGEDSSQSKDVLLDILAKAPNEKYHYCLVSFDDADLNRMTAENLGSMIMDLVGDDRNAVYYLADPNLSAARGKNVHAILIPENADMEKLNPELDRMAYNAHMVWSDSINGDYIKESRDFKKDTYDYLSSVALAVSVKYKLAEFGIKYENASEQGAAAEKFEKMLKAEENADVLNEVIALEHRRWVIYMTTGGYTAPGAHQSQKFYNWCLQSGNFRVKKDCDEEESEEMDSEFAGKKIHPCIVRSTSAAPLSSPVYTENDRHNWDNKSQFDDELDELDCMSVELHRFMRKKGRQNGKKYQQGTDQITSLENLLKGDERYTDVMREWNRYLFCTKNIWEGNYAYSKQYDRYEKALTDAIQKCNKNGGRLPEEPFQKFVKQMHIDIWPMIEANLYRDYKKNDEDLVRKIPFILTYRVGLSLVRGFSTTKKENNMNDVLFQNAASISVIKPGTVTYLLYLNRKSDHDVIKEMIKTLSAYLDRKRIRCEIQFLVCGSNFISEKQQDQWRKDFTQLAEKKMIRKFEMSFVTSEQEAIHVWEKSLQAHRTDLCEITDIFHSVSDNSAWAETCKRLSASFEFDFETKTFRNNDQCKFLSYIEDRTYLGIDEMFELAGASKKEYNYPALGSEYKQLWKIYTGKSKTRQDQKGADSRPIPPRDSMKNWNDMCGLIKNHLNDKEIRMTTIRGECRSYMDWPGISHLIEELANAQFLLAKKDNNKIVSFVFRDDDVKGLLTKEGNILEIYAYFSVCEQGWFDEEATGYKLQWATDTKVESELDLVLTRGFQSMIVECKARKELDDNFYFKLNSIAEMFGIGIHKVILTTKEAENSIQAKRGKLMGITTIYNMNDLENIADVLKNLIDESPSDT